MALKTIGQEPKCASCPLRQLNPQATFVGPVLPRGATRLLVGEAAGKSEEETGLPFQGMAGKVLDSFLYKAGVPRQGLAIANTLSCRPKNNIYPTSPEAKSYISKEDGERAVQHCYEHHLRPVLTSRQWDRIDCLGDKAMEAVTGKKGIYKYRGLPMECKETPGVVNVVATIHPAAILRDQSMAPAVVSDLKKSLVQAPESYNLWPSMEEVRAFSAKSLTIDIETAYPTDNITLVGVTDRPYAATVIPWKGPFEAEVRRILENAEELVGQNLLAFDLVVLCKHLGIKRPQVRITDTLLLSHLVAPDSPKDLEYLASIYTSKREWKSLAHVAKERYNAIDVDVTAQIAPQLRALARQLEVEDIYEYVSVPVSFICNEMTRTGLRIDRNRIAEVRRDTLKEQEAFEALLPEKLRTQQVAVNKRIPAPPGYKSPKTGKVLKYQTVASSETQVPWRSDKTVGEWLYGELGLETQKHIKTGKTTTDKYSLERLYRKSGNKAIDAIRELRSLDETLQTFAKVKMESESEIHPHFSVGGTNSGRLSSSGPNAQNIPEDLRKIYVPHRPGMYIVQVDFSSIENRLTAYLAGDTERLARFSQPDFSEHKFACERFFGIPMEEVVKSSDPESPYSKAKHVVHGMNYGLGARKMSLMYGVKEREVKELIAKWKQVIPKSFTWQERVYEEAKSQGYLTNPFGRKRWFWGSNIYTESLSFLPQSTAADIILRCMVALMYTRIEWPVEKVQKVVGIYKPLPSTTDLLVQVHDSLVFQTPKEGLDELVGILLEVLQQPWRELAGFSCPVAITYGPNWGEMEEYVAKG